MRAASLFLLLWCVGGDVSAQTRKPSRRPRPTVPLPGPHVRDNSQPVQDRLVPLDTSRIAEVATLRGIAFPLPWPLSRPGWGERPQLAEPLAPAPLALNETPRVSAILGNEPTGRGIGFRWVAGSIMSPSPLIPSSATIPPGLVPNFLAMTGLEIDRRLPWGLRVYVTGLGGYGQVNQTARLRGYRARPGAWFAVGSALVSGGIMAPLAWGPVSSYARLGGGVRGTAIDLPTAVWEIAPATDLGAGVRLGRGRLGLVMDARWIISSFNSARLPLARLPANPVSRLSETLVTTGVHLRLGR